MFLGTKDAEFDTDSDLLKWCHFETRTFYHILELYILADFGCVHKEAQVKIAPIGPPGIS